LLLSVVMKEGWNGLDLGDALQAESDQISSGLPLGVSLKKITDQAVNISSAVNEFMIKFAMAVCVVMLVSLLSLGWRVGIVVVAAIPLTLGAVFVIMMVTDRVFDRITLGALIISLGLLVDDAIIAIESMVVKMEEGMDRIQAAAYAWSHTAAPMLAGTLVTVIGFLPVGFARSTAGEYAGNIFWIVGFSLIASWIVAVVFTPYLGVKLLPEIKAVKGGHAGIYSTPGYQRIRQLVAWCVRKKYAVAGIVVGACLMAGGGMAVVKKQFFPNSDRPELLVEVQLPSGTSIETTSAAAKRIEHWLSQQPESRIVTSYIGAGAPRFFFSYNPELPDPSFAKILVLTPNAEARDRLKLRLRQATADGLAPEARIRATQLVFGPYSPFPVAFRVMGPEPEKLREIARSVEEIMRNDPNMRTVNVDWGERVPKLHFVLDQERLQLIGLSPEEASQQLQFLLNVFFFSSRRRHTSFSRDWSSDVCSSDLPEPGVFTSTTLDTRASTSPSGIAPLVSSDTRKPASQSLVRSSAQPFCARGSPPVTHTNGVPNPRTRERIASSSHHSPPWNAYVVSQYWQRSGQPVSRTNTVGHPAVSASPCSEWKISLTLRRVTRSAATMPLLRACPGKPAQALRGVLRGVAPRVLAQHLGQRGARRGILLLRVLRVAELEQRIGSLARVGPLLQHRAERTGCRLVIMIHVIGFSQPVLRVLGE